MRKFLFLSQDIFKGLLVGLVLVCFAKDAISQTSKYYETLRKAQSGDALSQNELGDFFYEGKEGLQINYSEAVKWYKKSAEQGCLNALANLAASYNDGLGVNKDHQKALKYYRECADRGDAHCQYYLAVKFFYGHGVIKNRNQSLYWATKSANQEYLLGMHILGSIYYDDSDIQDFGKALYWFKKAADKGYIYSQVNLGFIFYNGDGLIPDNNKAYYWFFEAVDNDEYNTDQYQKTKNTIKSIISELYYDGYGDGDYEHDKLARKWLKKSGYKMCYSCWGKKEQTCKTCKGTQFYENTGWDAVVHGNECPNSACYMGREACTTCNGIGLAKY